MTDTQIEVSQRAREAAAALWERKDGKPSFNAVNTRLGGMDDLPTAQAFARFERDILATRTDATPVAVEMVAELQLSAFLAGRGSIRTKANGNTHESSPGPTMDDYRRMARFALAEGWVDATPVAWMPIESAPKDGTTILLGAPAQTFQGNATEPRSTIGHWATKEECREVIGDCGGECRCPEYRYHEPYWLSWDGGFTEQNPPTHWMPLPDAPDATHPPANLKDRTHG